MKKIIVSSSDNKPRIELQIGNTAKFAKYRAFTSPASLLFSYTIEAEDFDSDGIDMTGHVDLNGSSIKFESGNDISTFFKTPSNLNKVRVDNVSPSSFKHNRFP